MDLIDIMLACRLIEKKLPPTILNLRGTVATTNQLPLTNNHKGDVWVVQSNNAEYVWMSDNASGSLSDYEDFGPIIDLSPYRTSADQDVIDSGKQAKVTASGVLKGDGNGGVSAAVAGTDYGTYSKPVNGIPSGDLAEGVQTSLGKADTALQSSSLTSYRTSADQDVIDSGKQAKVTASGILKGDGNGGVSAAVAGTDYDTASNIVSATAAMTPAQAVQIIENLGISMPGDPYPGVDLTVKFADEIENYTDEWAWIKARIQAGNFSGIHVNDYIPFTANDKVFHACVAGINVYYGYGDDGYKIGNHIDFISEELWPTAHRMNPVSWNNGLIPIESVTADGTATDFVLTKKMAAIDTIKMGDVALTGWSYDLENFTVTFEEAPAAGTLTITGIGSEHPWLASEGYLWLNSLAGQVPNSTDAPPATAVNYVDFTTDGVFYYLPQALKNVIVEKRFFLEKRYSATSKLTSSSNAKSIYIGKLWVPTEVEVYGTSVNGKSGYAIAGSAGGKYPIFIGKCPQKYTRGSSTVTYAHWWLLTAFDGSAGNWCHVMDSGGCGFQATTQTRRVPVCFRIA